MSLVNLARETLDTLKENGKTISDARWVGYYGFDRKKRISVDEFFVAAMRTNYHNGYGPIEIDTSYLVVVGSEWWEFMTMPKKDEYEVDDERHNLLLRR